MKNSSPERLERVIQEALKLAKKAKRHNKSLSGDNFYAQKLANLQADATNIFNDLTGQSAGDVSAMAEMIGHVFAPKTPPRLRKNTAQEILFSLRTHGETQQRKPSRLVLILFSQWCSLRRQNADI